MASSNPHLVARRIEDHYSDEAIQATRVEHHQDAQGLPIKVLYYSYQDLWQLDELVENGHAQSWLDVYFHPACQLQLSTGQLPTQTPFPGSKGYVDLSINWLYSWLPNSKSKRTIHFNQQQTSSKLYCCGKFVCRFGARILMYLINCTLRFCAPILRQLYSQQRVLNEVLHWIGGLIYICDLHDKIKRK